MYLGLELINQKLIRLLINNLGLELELLKDKILEIKTKDYFQVLISTPLKMLLPKLLLQSGEWDQESEAIKHQEPNLQIQDRGNTTQTPKALAQLMSWGQRLKLRSKNMFQDQDLMNQKTLL